MAIVAPVVFDPLVTQQTIGFQVANKKSVAGNILSAIFIEKKYFYVYLYCKMIL